MSLDLSYKTAITRNKPSAPMRYIAKWAKEPGKLVHALTPGNVNEASILDYGCGKGFDADYYGMEKYDPHYFPDKPKGPFMIITCNYVMNVVSESEEARIIEDIYSLLYPIGVAHITVRRDLPEFGKIMSGYKQRNSEPVCHGNRFINKKFEAAIIPMYWVKNAYQIYTLFRKYCKANLLYDKSKVVIPMIGDVEETTDLHNF